MTRSVSGLSDEQAILSGAEYKHFGPGCSGSGMGNVTLHTSESDPCSYEATEAVAKEAQKKVLKLQRDMNP